MRVVETADHDLPAPGTLFAGRYRIERLLGVGGMGSVLLARHEVIGQQVALKLLHPEAASSPAAVERFVKEARAASKIEGQHVVRIYDVGTHDGTAKGRPYLCMEYLRGQDLGQLFESSGPLPAHEVCSALLDAIIALAQAHGAGIVHRDLKPSNLFFAEQPVGKPVLKVLDFGIAKMEEGLGSVHATATGMIMGTPSYMAPEQMRSSKMVDARADIWALGVIAYELLTGRLPYQGESLGDILFAVVEKPPPLPHELRPELGEELSAVVMKCLQRDPGRRYASVTELSDALEPFATVSRVGTSAALRLSMTGENLSGPPMDLENARTEQLHAHLPASPKTVSEWVTESAVRPRGNARTLVGVAALFLVGGVGMAAAWRAKMASSDPGAVHASASPASARGTSPVPVAPPPTAAADLASLVADAGATAAPTTASAGDAGLAPARRPVAHAAGTPHPAGAAAAAPVPPDGDKSGMTRSKGWEGLPTQ